MVLLPIDDFYEPRPYEEIADNPWAVLEMWKPAAYAELVLLNWIGFALYIKRCHDRDRSGWYLLIALIPFVGLLWIWIELGLLRGTVGPNRFGPDPLRSEIGDTLPV